MINILSFKFETADELSIALRYINSLLYHDQKVRSSQLQYSKNCLSVHNNMLNQEN